MPRTDPGAEIQHVRGRDPRLRAAGRSATARADAGRQPSRSSRASSCPSTRPPPPARPGAPPRRPARAPRPRTASPSSPPTRPRAPAPLNGARNVRTDAAVRRRDPRARDLAGDRLDPLRRDLRPMLIQPHHDRHADTSPSIPRSPARPRHAAGQRSPSHTVNHGRYLRFDWPAARPQSARAYIRRSTRRTGHLHRPVTPTGT